MLVLLKYNLGTSALFQVKNENLKLGSVTPTVPGTSLHPLQRQDRSHWTSVLLSCPMFMN